MSYHLTLFLINPGEKDLVKDRSYIFHKGAVLILSGFPKLDTIAH